MGIDCLSKEWGDITVEAFERESKDGRRHFDSLAHRLHGIHQHGHAYRVG